MRPTSMLLVVAFAALLVGCGARPVAQPPSETTAATAATVTAPTSWDADTPIGRIVAERPETARVFELVGLDYCCGGETPLGDAARAEGVDVDRLLRAIAEIGTDGSRTDASRNWDQAPMPELIDHIVATHHAFLRRELPQIGELVATVARVHGESHPELADVERTFAAIRDEIGPHLELEEQRVFPAVRELVEGGRPEGLEAFLTNMRTDHDGVGAGLHALRDLTDGYVVPDDACVKYRQMLEGLALLEADLHQHVHLENNVLLPRARALFETR